MTKCAKLEEAKTYDDVEHTFEATEQIEKICHDIPIHVVFGEILDLTYVSSLPTSSSYLTHALCPPHRPSYGQASAIDKSKGRDVASVVRIPGAGHMVRILYFLTCELEPICSSPDRSFSKNLRSLHLS